MYLSIRTDKPDAELGLFDGTKRLDYHTWEADRKLSAQIHHKIEDLLNKNKLKYSDLDGILVFEGPGSFTGLRIGISVANAFARGLNIPIVSGQGSDWASQSIQLLAKGAGKPLALPFYGQPAKITKPKK